MSIQRMAQSVLLVLEDLYRIIDSSYQSSGHLSFDESENLLQSLCTLSDLINHIHQAKMCGQTPSMLSDWNFQHNYRGYPMHTDSAIREVPPYPRGPNASEYIFYQPFRIIPNNSYVSSWPLRRDPNRKERSRSKKRRHRRFSHGNRPKKMRRPMSSSSSRSSSRTSSTDSFSSRSSQNIRSSSGSSHSEKRRPTNPVDQKRSNRKTSPPRSRSRSRQRKLRQRQTTDQQPKSRQNRNRRIFVKQTIKNRSGSPATVPISSPLQRSKIDRSSMTQQ